MPYVRKMINVDGEEHVYMEKVETGKIWDFKFVKGLPNKSFANQRLRLYPHHYSDGCVDIAHLRAGINYAAWVIRMAEKEAEMRNLSDYEKKMLTVHKRALRHLIKHLVNLPVCLKTTDGFACNYDKCKEPKCWFPSD